MRSLLLLTFLTMATYSIAQTSAEERVPPTSTVQPTVSPALPATPPSTSEPWSNKKLMLLFTGTLAGAAVVQVFIYAAQAYLMRRTLEETRRSSEAAGKAAAAPSQLERPWVIIEIGKTPSISASNSASGSTTVTVDYTLHNCGRSPAWVTARNLGVRWLGPKENPTDLKAPARIHRSDTFNTVFAPILPGQPEEPQDVSEPVLVPWDKGTSTTVRVLFFGVIGYEDVFGDSHDTGFAWEVIWPQVRMLP